MKKYFEYQSSCRVCAGDDALAHLPYELAQKKVVRPLILTDGNLKRAGLLAMVQKALIGIDAACVFDDIPQDSGVETVQAAASFYRAQHCDGLIALGGGSVLDTAKGVALLIASGTDDLLSLIGFEAPVGGENVPFFAIPTTSGTGSEATPVAVIAQPEKQVKIEFVTAQMCPQVAVLDPRMTLVLPPRLTAATAMDALCHAIEAFTCSQKNPISDGYAIAAVRLIAERLPEVMQDPQNASARLSLAVASYLSGTAFGSSMVGGVHAIGHALGGVCHLPHGEAMAILLPAVMRYTAPVCRAPYAELLLHLAGPEAYASTPPELRADAAADAVAALSASLHETCGLPVTLAETGKVSEADFERVADTALHDGAILFHPCALEKEDILDILTTAYRKTATRWPAYAGRR